ncbi:uncharacterized protein [Elaeis guineensis]|nr:glycosylphosphatidylinositol anchor attachment 1 protein isoform X2 [Elaeis guineensis]
MAGVGAEVYYHKFLPHKNQFHPLHFFSCTPNTVTVQNNSSCASFGVNSVGIIRAPRGDGKEAIVLVTPYNPWKIELSEALSLGLAFSIFSLLSQVSWLAKDVVWLAADSQFGEYTSVSAWLKDYHSPVFFSESRKMNVDVCHESNSHQDRNHITVKGENANAFRRAGTMAAALVLKVLEKKERQERDSLTIYAEASNGQMPNLDLINIVHYLAVHRQGLRVKIATIGSLLNSVWLRSVGEIVQRLCRVAKSLDPRWKYDITSADYVEGSATLASSMYHQAIGVPTGSHGAFRDYQVDAVTLELSPGFSLKNENSQSAFFLRGGRLIEGVIRSVNNLLEKFHQSFFLYFLTAPNKFVSVGVYMIAFALLIAPLPIVAVAPFSGKNEIRLSTDKGNQTPGYTCTDEIEISIGSWKWLHAAKVVFMTHLWAVIVLLLPYFMSQIPYISPTTSMLVWVAVATSALLILYLILGSPYSNDCEWVLLKSVMIAAAFIGLGLMSIINFSTAQIGALIVVPMCLIVRPLKRHKEVALCMRVMLMTCNLVLAVIGFPPTALLILKGLSEGFGRVGIGDFWVWAEFLWIWNSATYLYLLLVHLPCWALYVHILLHP